MKTYQFEISRSEFSSFQKRTLTGSEKSLYLVHSDSSSVRWTLRCEVGFFNFFSSLALDFRLELTTHTSASHQQQRWCANKKTGMFFPDCLSSILHFFGEISDLTTSTVSLQQHFNWRWVGIDAVFEIMRKLFMHNEHTRVNKAEVVNESIKTKTSSLFCSSFHSFVALAVVCLTQIHHDIINCALSKNYYREFSC